MTLDRRTIAILVRISDLLSDCEADYDERATYFSDNGKDSAARWNERMRDRCQRAAEQLEALLNEE